MILNIWTDGSCDNNPNHEHFAKGGWGYCILDENNNLQSEDLGNQTGVTSQKMEMQAVIEALKFVKNNLIKGERINVKIHSDSAYIVNCMNEKWYIRWEEEDFYGIKNEEYWKPILKLIRTKLLKVDFIKVKGHSKLEWNDYVDLLAGEARKELME